MSNNIEKLRLKVPISQGQFAKSIGKKPTTFSQHERETRGIGVNYAWEIVNGLRKAGLKVDFEDVFPDPSKQEDKAA